MRRIKIFLLLSIIVVIFTACGGGGSSSSTAVIIPDVPDTPSTPNIPDVPDTPSTPNDDDCYKSPYSYTYKYIPSNIGDTITVRGVEYTMKAMPFVEFGTGDHYYIKKPIARISTDTDFPFDLNTHYVQQGNACYPSSFSGFPSNNATIDYSRNYSAQMSTLNITDQVFPVISVKINQTLLHFIFTSSLSKTMQSTPINPGDIDLRDDIDWSSLNIDTTLVEDFKTLMNYVEIVKIPQ